MPQRFYFAPSDAAPLGPGTHPSNATEYVTHGSGAATTVFVPDSLGSGSMLPDFWDSSGPVQYTQATLAVTTQQRMRMGRFYTPPLTAGITISTNEASTKVRLDWGYAFLETNLNVNLRAWAPVIYAWRPSTGAVVAVLQNYLGDGAGPEPTVRNELQTSRGWVNFMNNNVNTSATLLAGDIIVVEPYLVFEQAMAAAYSVDFVLGGGTVITADNVVVVTPAAYIEFGTNLPIGNPLSYAYPKIYGTSKTEYIAPFTFLEATLRGLSVISSAMSDGLLLQVHMVSAATITSSLTTQILMTSSLQSIAKTEGWLPQTHSELTSFMQSVAYSVLLSGVSSPLPALRFAYSGGPLATNPSQSLGGKIAEVAYRDQLASWGSAIQGIAIAMASGFVPGTYTVTYVSSTKELTIHTPPYSFSRFLTGEVAMSLGANETGYLLLNIDYGLLATADATTFVSVVDINNTLFPDPDRPTLLAGKTEYRCLYIRNGATGDATNVTLRVSGAVEGVTLGTEYVNSFVVGDTTSASSLLRRARSTTAGGRAANVSLVAAAQQGLQGQSGGAPFVFISSSLGQASDGVSVDLPLTILDVTDSTGVLAGISFSDTLSWPVVKAGKSVTFWVKKVQPPSPALPTFENLRFALTATI